MKITLKTNMTSKMKITSKMKTTSKMRMTLKMKMTSKMKTTSKMNMTLKTKMTSKKKFAHPLERILPEIFLMISHLNSHMFKTCSHEVFKTEMELHLINMIYHNNYY